MISSHGKGCKENELAFRKGRKDLLRKRQAEKRGTMGRMCINFLRLLYQAASNRVT
jgi:hypothetical protein